MKPSQQKLGLMIQKYLLENRLTIDDLAEELQINPDSLSNLIHGRRRFKDATLEKLANTSIFKQGGFTYQRLRAYRAVDDYQAEELILALAEYAKDGKLNTLDRHFTDNIENLLTWGGFPPVAHPHKPALIQLAGTSTKSP